MECLLQFRIEYINEQIYVIQEKYHNQSYLPFGTYLSTIDTLIPQIKCIWKDNEQKIFETFELITKPLIDLINIHCYNRKIIELSEHVLDMNVCILEHIYCSKNSKYILDKFQFDFMTYNIETLSNEYLNGMILDFRRLMSCFGYDVTPIYIKRHNCIFTYSIICITNILNIYMNMPRLTQPYLNKDIQSILYNLLNHVEN